MDWKRCCPAASAYELCKMLQISEEVRHNRTECTECLVPYCYTRHQTMHLHHYHRPSLILKRKRNVITGIVVQLLLFPEPPPSSPVCAASLDAVWAAGTDQSCRHTLSNFFPQLIIMHAELTQEY